MAGQPHKLCREIHIGHHRDAVVKERLGSSCRGCRIGIENSERRDRLHDYLRQSLPAMRSPMSTLGREFALADSYLTLMRLRLGDKPTGCPLCGAQWGE